MSWYRTYRPQTISELHSPAIREAFNRIRESGTFSHAYLLTGPKGTGKTSCARILAKMLNCEKNKKFVLKMHASHKQDRNPFFEPCGMCETCRRITNGSSLCVTELDAASNRGIDDIRSLRERVHLAPSDGLVSVYIIDEVHMLTTEAFNALLKVLEEPPAHVVFVLATTEMRKVPDTIISRCTLIQFARATSADLLISLQKIAKNEGITVSDELLSDIASRADGSYRDAIKLFEQIAQGKKKLTSEDTQISAEGSGQTSAAALLLALEEQNIQEVATFFKACEKQGIDLLYLHKQLLQIGHEKLVEKIMARDTVSINTLQSLLESLDISPDPLLPIPNLPFQLASLSWCLNGRIPTPQTIQPQKSKIITSTAPSENPVSSVKIQEGEPLTISATTLEEQWPKLLIDIKKVNATIEALLRAARPLGISGKTATIEVFYAFHKEQLEQEKHRRTLEGVLCSMFGIPTMKAVFVLGDKNSRPLKKKQLMDEKLIQDTTEAML